MPRLIVNLQGSLANPNMALEAAKRGKLESLPPGPTGRIDSRDLAKRVIQVHAVDAAGKPVTTGLASGND